MKQKDVALILIIAGISTVIAIVLASVLISPPKNRQTKVQVVDKVTNDFPPIDERYINTSSSNPTRTVRIGGNNNPEPFK